MTTHAERKQETRKLLHLYFRNVDYLRRKRGMTFKALAAHVSGEGFKASKQAVNRYIGAKTKMYNNAGFYYLVAYSVALNEPLGKMMSIDYEQEGL